jgi:hypothetical protein
MVWTERHSQQTELRTLHPPFIGAANRNWEHMTPFRWVLSTALLVAPLVDYVVDTPVTHTAQRTVIWVFTVWFIANRPHIRQYWRDAEPSDTL